MFWERERVRRIFREVSSHIPVIFASSCERKARLL